ncbi:MAG: hypothetical protein K6F76_00875 [Clostridiales bacterium]|nr:hypothetical protein [Clostridiales bacterium]
MSINRRSFRFVFAVLIIAVTSAYLCGCNVDNTSNSASSGYNMSTAESITEYEHTDSETDYSKYYELNASYDSEKRLTRTDVYSPQNECIGYRTYTYIKDDKISEIKTFTADDKPKSTVKYEYTSDNGFSSSLFDEKDNFLFKMSVYTKNGKEISEYYNSKNQLIMYKIADENGSEKYYDKNDTLLEGSNLTEKKDAIEKLYCEYLY